MSTESDQPPTQAGDQPPTRPMTAGPQTLASGRYHLHRRLGAGGMGLVIQATDTRLHREVAIKLLADNLAADETARERFLREARAAAQLTDPHIVQVHDVDEEDGRPYLVMEHVDGPSLGDVLAASGPLDPQEVMDVAADALAGIARAHDHGVLHRDIKPGNFLRAPSGVIKVTDFGVAHAGDGPELTRTGMVIGTAPYLAPERAAGEPASVRTDLYALGATLYELLTGQRPPAEPATRTGLDVEVPAALSHLIDRLLATDPQQRPASAQTALALLAGEVPPGGPTPATAAPTPGPATADATLQRHSEEDRSAAAPSGAAPSGDAQPETALLEAEQGSAEEPRAPDRSPSVRWGTVVGVAIGLLLVAVLFQGLRGDGTEAPEGVERSDDPAQTARNLADWLEERAGE